MDDSRPFHPTPDEPRKARTPVAPPRKSCFPSLPEKVGGKGKSLVHPVFPGKSPRILLNSHGRVKPLRLENLRKKAEATAVAGRGWYCECPHALQNEGLGSHGEPDSARFDSG